jgi:hypothetical protein
VVARAARASKAADKADKAADKADKAADNNAERTRREKRSPSSSAE